MTRSGTEVEEALGRARFEAEFGGRDLLPAIIQQHDSGEVLMLGWMDGEALPAARSPKGA